VFLRARSRCNGKTTRGAADLRDRASARVASAANVHGDERTDDARGAWILVEMRART